MRSVRGFLVLVTIGTVVSAVAIAHLRIASSDDKRTRIAGRGDGLGSDGVGSGRDSSDGGGSLGSDGVGSGRGNSDGGGSLGSGGVGSSRGSSVRETMLGQQIGHDKETSRGETPKGMRHKVYDLIPNRHLAHLIRDKGLAVFFGEIGFPRYAHGNFGHDWYTREKEDGIPVAFLRGKRAVLQLPLSKAQSDQVKSLYLHLKGKSRSQRLQVVINGRNLGSKQVAAGWQTLKWDIPRGTAIPGENEVTLRFAKIQRWGAHAYRSGGPIHWLWIGNPMRLSASADPASADPASADPASADPASTDSASADPASITKDELGSPEGSNTSAQVAVENRLAAGWTVAPTGESKSYSLLLPPYGGLAYYLAVPASAHLEVNLVGASNSACFVEVSAEMDVPHSSNARAEFHQASPTNPTDSTNPTAPTDENGLPNKTTLSTRVPVTASGGEMTAELDLSGIAGSAARIEIVAGQGCRDTRVIRGGLTIPGPSPVVHKGKPPRNIVLWLIDTLRADRIKAINPSSRILSKTYDRLSAEGTTFVEAYAQGNESFVSHAAIFTGQYPRRNGIRHGGKGLTNEHWLISEAMKAAGLKTGGYSSNGYIAARNGYVQGWDTYVNTLASRRPYLSPSLVSNAKAWIEKYGASPFFLYIGAVDPHVTYRSHKDILPIYDPGPYEGLFQKSVSGQELGQIKAGKIKVTERDKVRIEAIYDDEVTFAGHHLGVFLDWLEKQGKLDDTMIVLTSDHGDEFWEHGSVGHGQSVYEELVHVPIIIRYPPMFPAGLRVDEGVDTIDIFPTLLDVMGLPIPDDLQGSSLLALANGVDRGYPRPSVATHHGRFYGMRLGRWKLISGPRGKRTLYDLTSDAGATRDTLGSSPAAARLLTDAMNLFLAYGDAWRKADWGVASNLKEGFEP